MDYSHYIISKIPNNDKLQAFGFERNQDGFLYVQDLSDSELYVQISISRNGMDVKVMDRAFDEEYMPFSVKNNTSAIRGEVELLLENIVENCFDGVNTRRIIIDYMQQKYGTQYETPWEDLPNFCTFKTSNSKKWYAIIMDIKAKCIGFEGDALIDVMNVKLDPSHIPQIVDNKHFFFAYHMNKKYWISILLDKDLDVEKTKALIDESYSIVEKPKKKK